MAAINFQNRFEAPILAGRKFQTVRKLRADGKERCQPGDTVKLFVNPRTKEMRHFASVEITEVRAVELRSGPARAYRIGGADGQWFTGYELERFAKFDGFASWAELEEFFFETHKLEPGDTFVGELIRWRPLSLSSSDWQPPPPKKRSDYVRAAGKSRAPAALAGATAAAMKKAKRS